MAATVSKSREHFEALSCDIDHLAIAPMNAKGVVEQGVGLDGLLSEELRYIAVTTKARLERTCRPIRAYDHEINRAFPGDRDGISLMGASWANAHFAAVGIATHFYDCLWMAVDPIGCMEGEKRRFDDLLISDKIEPAVAAIHEFPAYDDSALLARVNRERSFVLENVEQLPPNGDSDVRPTVNDQLMEMFTNDARMVSETAQGLANKLGVTASAVKKTPAWKAVMQERNSNRDGLRRNV